MQDLLSLIDKKEEESKQATIKLENYVHEFTLQTSC